MGNSVMLNGIEYAGEPVSYTHLRMVYRMTEWIECTLDKLGEIVGGATPSTKCEDCLLYTSMQDGTKIPMDDILSIDGELFLSLE